VRCSVYSANHFRHKHVIQVIRDFYLVKIGPEVVLAARWRPEAKMTSPFDSPTLILYRLSVENFRLSLTIQKLFMCVYFAAAWKFGIPVPKFGVFGGF
jgi:hypothetical protein